MTRFSETFVMQLKYAKYRGYSLKYRLIARARLYMNIDLKAAKLGQYKIRAGR